MFLPVFIYMLVYCYVPMYGLIISFQDYIPAKGVFGSNWVGLKHFVNFFEGIYSWKIIWNTFYLNILYILFSFPLPIIFALALNEVGSLKFKKVVQTVSYLPHFISVVVIIGIFTDFLSLNGVVNTMLGKFGISQVDFLGNPGFFRGIYIVSGIWQELGWSSVIYFAALSGVDVQLYDAAYVDGATRMQRLWHVTIPQIVPTMVITLLLSLGSMFSVGFEKVFLLQNPLNTSVSEVISTYVYKRGLIDGSYSFSTAVGLFNTLSNFITIILFNKIVEKLSNISLW